MSGSTGSTPNDWAGGPSIMILIHKICIAFKGFGIRQMVAMAISDKAALLLFVKNALKLS